MKCRFLVWYDMELGQDKVECISIRAILRLHVARADEPESSESERSIEEWVNAIERGTTHADIDLCTHSVL